MDELRKRLALVVDRAYPGMHVTIGGLNDRSTLYFKFGQGQVEAYEIESRSELEEPSDDYIIFVAGIRAQETKNRAMAVMNSSEPRPRAELAAYLSSLPEHKPN